jgi:hypothetical protein
MTEQQVYRLLEQRKGYELREYAAVAIASVSVTGDIRTAPYQGFNKLFRYISTNSIAMTAPVVQREDAKDSWSVEFVMPAGSHADSLPAGHDIGVTVRQQPKEVCAVVSFRGGVSNHKVLAKAESLRADLERDGITITGPLQVARFNSPFVPVPLRYNEIRYPVSL